MAGLYDRLASLHGELTSGLAAQQRWAEALEQAVPQMVSRELGGALGALATSEGKLERLSWRVDALGDAAARPSEEPSAGAELREELAAPQRETARQAAGDFESRLAALESQALESAEGFARVAGSTEKAGGPPSRPPSQAPSRAPAGGAVWSEDGCQQRCVASVAAVAALEERLSVMQTLVEKLLAGDSWRSRDAGLADLPPRPAPHFCATDFGQAVAILHKS